MKEKRWREFWVDKGLRPRWLERLNAVKRITITGTCSGHRGRPAFVAYDVKSDRDVILALAHLGEIARIVPLWGGKKNVVQVLKPPSGGGYSYLSKVNWWSRVIRWLESWYGAH